jgi:hypothetical protein
LLKRGPLDLAASWYRHAPESVAVDDPPTFLRAIPVPNVAGYERLTAPGANSFPRQIPTAVRFERRGAVGADHPKVLEPVVVRDAVDVVEHQRHAAATPVLALTAQLTLRRQEAGIEQTSLQVEAVVRRVLHENFVERNLISASCPSTPYVGVEMVCLDVPPPGPLLKGPIIRALDGIAEVSERVGPARRLLDGGPRVGFGEGWSPRHQRTYVRIILGRKTRDMQALSPP